MSLSHINKKSNSFRSFTGNEDDWKVKTGKLAEKNTKSRKNGFLERSIERKPVVHLVKQ